MALLIFQANFNIINVGDRKNINEDFKMNKLEQATQELLEAGYSVEEIKAAFEEVIEQAKQSNTDCETVSN